MDCFAALAMTGLGSDRRMAALYPSFFHPHAISPSSQNALWCRSLRVWRNL